MIFLRHDVNMNFIVDCFFVVPCSHLIFFFFFLKNPPPPKFSPFPPPPPLRSGAAPPPPPPPLPRVHGPPLQHRKAIRGEVAVERGRPKRQHAAERAELQAGQQPNEHAAQRVQLPAAVRDPRGPRRSRDGPSRTGDYHQLYLRRISPGCSAEQVDGPIT